MKRGRVDLTEEQISHLEVAWENGLKTTNKKRRPNTEYLSEITGLSNAKIDQWIGNRRAKDRRKGKSTNLSGPTQKSRVKRLQGPNGYSLFVQGYKRGTKPKGEFLKEMAEKWQRLPVEEKSAFSERAATIRQSPSLGMSREKLISRHLAIMNESCKFLSSLGVYAGGFLIDTQDQETSVQFGPPKVIKVLEPTLQSLKSELLVPTLSEPAEEEYKRVHLKKIVQAKFNSAWNKASKSKGRIPYSKIKKKRVLVTCSNLPDGVSFENPSKYPLDVLQAIADGPDIDLRILHSQAEPTVIGSLQAGPSVNGSLQAGPSVTGSLQAGPSVTGPSQAGPSVTGPSQAGPTFTGPSQAGPTFTGSLQAGLSVTGSLPAGPSVTVPSHAGSTVTRPSQAGSTVTGPSQAGPSVTGHLQAGPSVQDASSILAQLSMGGHTLQVMTPSEIDDDRSVEKVLSLYETSARPSGNGKPVQRRKNKSKGPHVTQEENKDTKLYKVERIIRTKYKKSLVKWEGFETPSWELTKNIIEI